jgi:hypothetical protein
VVGNSMLLGRYKPKSSDLRTKPTQEQKILSNKDLNQVYSQRRAATI